MRDGRALAWSALVGLSLILAGALEYASLPAALLLGPMVAAIVLAVRGVGLKIAPRPFAAAQAIVGCLIASSLNGRIIASFLADWPLFLAVIAATLAASSTLGYLLSRWQVLPGTAAVWGSSPGAATAMTIMANAFGADARLVAFMLYLRVVCVALAASILSAILTGKGAGAGQPVDWFPALDWPGFGITLLIALAGAWIGGRLAIPAGALIVPLVISAALNVAGLVHLVLPEWLLALSYAVVGWKIGLGFTRDTLRHAARALPRILLSVLLLIGFCGGLAYVLVHFAGIDPLSAYLATSPGGMDSIAIIAASSKVDLPFVMALQVVRFVAVMSVGPALARFVARSQIAREQKPAA